MTRTNVRTHWLQFATTALVVATVTLGSASTASATTKELGQDGFLDCYKEMISHAPHDPPTQDDADIATHDCCLNTGGSWSTNDYHHGFCIWPPTDSDSGRAPRPGAIARNPDLGRLAY